MVNTDYTRRTSALALCGMACVFLAACAGSKESSGVKPASAFRSQLHAATEDINLYLNEHNPANTSREELQENVGGLARAFSKIGAEAAPLQGKTADRAYGVVAADAEDGVIVAGNLASALAADPAKHADAGARLKTAIDDWVAYNDELTRGDEGGTFEPTRWWEATAWRGAAAAGPPLSDD